jgi:hypothetical protein
MQVGGHIISVGKPVSRKPLRKTRLHRISKGFFTRLHNKIRCVGVDCFLYLTYNLALWRISTTICQSSGSVVVINSLIMSNRVF